MEVKLNVGEKGKEKDKADEGQEVGLDGEGVAKVPNGDAGYDIGDDGDGDDEEFDDVGVRSIPVQEDGSLYRGTCTGEGGYGMSTSESPVRSMNSVTGLKESGDDPDELDMGCAGCVVEGSALSCLTASTITGHGRFEDGVVGRAPVLPSSSASGGLTSTSARYG